MTLSRFGGFIVNNGKPPGSQDSLVPIAASLPDRQNTFAELPASLPDSQNTFAELRQVCPTARAHLPNLGMGNYTNVKLVFG